MEIDRKCMTCHRTKQRHLWLAHQWKKVGPAQCKSCYKKGPAYDRALDVRYRNEFGITLADYDRMLKLQDGRCFICLKQPGRRRLAVDHDHSIEEEVGIRRSIRGLLCRNCNEYLGHIGDDLNAGLRINTYLRQAPYFDRTTLQ